MEVKELVLHPAQLKEVELLELNARRNTEMDSLNDEVNFQVSVTGEVTGLQSGNAVINVRIINDDFDISVVELGKFEFDGDIEQDQIKHFLEAQGLRLLWSYVRETIYDVTNRMLRRPVLIPTLDVITTLQKTQKGM